MNREFLTKLGIEKEAIDKIMAENGKDIETLKTEKASLDAEKTTLTASVTNLTKQVGDRDTQIITIKKSAGDNEELKKTIGDLQTVNKTEKTANDVKLKQLAFDHKLDTGILKLNPRNAKAVRALLSVDKISIDNDNLIGFDDQIAALKESDGYLFETPGDTGGGGNPANSGANNTDAELDPVAKAAIWGGNAPK